MKHIKLFETEQEYNSYKEGENAVYPHVCLAQDTNKVFVKKDNIELITFYINLHNRELLEYQSEKGMTWMEWCSSKYNNDDWYTDSETSAISGNYEESGFNAQWDVIYHDEYESLGKSVIQSTTYNVYKDGSGIGGGI